MYIYICDSLNIASNKLCVYTTHPRHPPSCGVGGTTSGELRESRICCFCEVSTKGPGMARVSEINRGLIKIKLRFDTNGVRY